MPGSLWSVRILQGAFHFLRRQCCFMPQMSLCQSGYLGPPCSTLESLFSGVFCHRVAPLTTLPSRNMQLPPRQSEQLVPLLPRKWDKGGYLLLYQSCIHTGGREHTSIMVPCLSCATQWKVQCFSTRYCIQHAHYTWSVFTQCKCVWLYGCIKKKKRAS